MVNVSCEKLLETAEVQNQATTMLTELFNLGLDEEYFLNNDQAIKTTEIFKCDKKIKKESVAFTKLITKGMHRLAG